MVESLFYPRYKVMAIWPGMHAEPFNLHQIVTLQPYKEGDAEGFIYIPNKHIPRSFMWQSFFHLFPHLFKELKWWEERRPEEMPEYVKHEHGWIGQNIGVNHQGDSFVFSGRNDTVEWPFCFFMPVSKEEYEKHISEDY